MGAKGKKGAGGGGKGRRGVIGERGKVMAREKRCNQSSCINTKYTDEAFSFFLPSSLRVGNGVGVGIGVGLRVGVGVLT